MTCHQNPDPAYEGWGLSHGNYSFTHKYVSDLNAAFGLIKFKQLFRKHLFIHKHNVCCFPFALNNYLFIKTLLNPVLFLKFFQKAP